MMSLETNSSSVMKAAAGFHSGCFAVNLSSMAALTARDGLISADVENLFSLLKTVIFLPLLFAIGAPTNCLNMVVFYRQGLKQRINLCLFCLSLADLLLVCHAFTMYAERMTLRPFSGGPRIGPWHQWFVNNGLMVLGMAYWISQFLSALIAAERCFCVMAPLKVNTVLKTRSMVAVIVCGSLLIAGARVITTQMKEIRCLFDVDGNRTVLMPAATQFYLQNKQFLDIWDGVIFGMLLMLLLNAVVFVTTIITSAKLRSIVSWRQTASSTSSSMSTREIAVTRMLIYLSLQFMVLNSPTVFGKIAGIFLSDFNPSGKFRNLYFTWGHLTECCSVMNSSLNFLVYLIAGSKYRETLKGLFVKSSREKSTVVDSKGRTCVATSDETTTAQLNVQAAARK